MEVATISGQPWAGTNESFPEEIMQHNGIECSYVLCQKCFCTCLCRWRQKSFGMHGLHMKQLLYWANSGNDLELSWPSPGPLMSCCSPEQSLH